MDIDLEKLARDFVDQKIIVGYANSKEAVDATALLLEAGVLHGNSCVSREVMKGNHRALGTWDSLFYNGGMEYCYSPNFTRFHFKRIMFDELPDWYPSEEYETGFEIDEEIYKKVFH